MREKTVFRLLSFVFCLLVTGYLLLFTFPKEAFAAQITPPDLVDLTINNSNGPVTIDNGGSVSLSWTSNANYYCGVWDGISQLDTPPYSPNGGPYSIGPLSGPVTKTYTLRCLNGSDDLSSDWTSDYVQVIVNAPLCTATPINCSDSTPANNCSTNNTTQTCTLTGPSPCIQVQTTQTLTTNNCDGYGGYTCQSNSCILTNTLNLMVYDYSNYAWSDGTISIPQNNPDSILLSWQTTGSINSCYAYEDYPGVDVFTGSKALNGSQFINPNLFAVGSTVHFYLTCTNPQGYYFTDYVGVTTGNPFCTTNPVCGGCSAPIDTCSTSNGTQNCTWTGPTPCTQVGFNQPCTVNNCVQGNYCNASGVCVLNAYSLEVHPGGTGSGTVSSSPAGINSCAVGSSCTATFNSGASVSLTAAPASGSTFAGWSGSGCSGTGSCTVTMDASKTLSATFSQNPNCATSSTPWTSVACVLRSDITTTNTCSNNGRQTRTLDGPAPCIQTTQIQDCNVLNCSPGYNCSTSGQCVPNVIAPTVDLTVNFSTAPIPVPDGNNVFVGWSTTNSPASCTASSTGNIWTGPKSISGGLEIAGPLSYGSTPYTFIVTCLNSAGSVTKSVPISVYTPYQTCPTTCHTDIQTVPNGSGGQTTCSPNNTTDYPRVEPPICRTSGGTLSDGLCSTYTYSANCSGVCSGNQCITAPTVELYVNFSIAPGPIPNGNNVIVTWGNTNSPASCSASSTGNVWTGNKDNSGGGDIAGPLSGPGTYTFTLTCSNAAAPSGITRSVAIAVDAPPPCTATPTNCSSCSASANTCSTNNGSQTCTLTTGSGTCTPTSTTQACTVNNCSSGYNCSTSGTCVPNVIAPTVDLTVNKVTIDNNTPVTLSWTTTNSPTSCTASATPASSTWTGDPGHEATNSRSTGNLTGPADYTYSIYCTNTAGDSPSDSVTVTVNGPPPISIDQQAGSAIFNFLQQNIPFIPFRE